MYNNDLMAIFLLINKRKSVITAVKQQPSNFSIRLSNILIRYEIIKPNCYCEFLTSLENIEFIEAELTFYVIL